MLLEMYLKRHNFLKKKRIISKMKLCNRINIVTLMSFCSEKWCIILGQHDITHFIFDFMTIKVQRTYVAINTIKLYLLFLIIIKTLQLPYLIISPDVLKYQHTYLPSHGKLTKTRDARVEFPNNAVGVSSLRASNSLSHM